MSTVTFTGLASGIDTASLVESLIEVESAPITLLEDKVEYLEAKEETYTEFDGLLDSLNLAVMSLNNESDLSSFEVSNNGSDFFSVSTTSLTEEGTYSIEVLSLAERQKDVCNESFADTDTTLLTGELQIGTETVSYENVTLQDLIDTINSGDYGVTSSIINDGTENGYRLVVTADTAGEEIDLLGTGDLTIDTATSGHTIEGTQAHAIVDGIDYYSTTNSLSSAIKGTTITLLDISDDGADRLTIEKEEEDTIAERLDTIVTAFNDMVDFIDSIYESDPTLANSMKTVTRSLKNYLTDSTLLNLGLSTDWETGQLSFDEDVLSEAYDSDPDGVIESLFGDDDSDGIMVRLDTYISEQVSSSSGFLANKTDTIDSDIDRLNDSIDLMTTRLEKRQATLEAQFTAMETLVSSLNSQASYLESFFEDY